MNLSFHMLQKQANLIKILTEIKVKREKKRNYESVLSCSLYLFHDGDITSSYAVQGYYS